MIRQIHLAVALALAMFALSGVRAAAGTCASQPVEARGEQPAVEEGQCGACESNRCPDEPGQHLRHSIAALRSATIAGGISLALQGFGG